MKIGLQLYSVRDALSADYLGTLQKVKQMGYAGVELFGAHLEATSIKAMLEETGLIAIAHHFSFSELHENFEGCVERAKGIGLDFLVCSWSMPTEDLSWQDIIKELAAINAKCAALGLRFAYHNHDHEMTQQLNGTAVLEQIYQIMDLEIDLAWVHAGGQNPAEYLEQHTEKTKLLHFKDVKLEGGTWQTVELGHGSVPLTEILSVLKTTAKPWLVVEQDHSPDPIGSAERNFQWLTNAWQ
jgi:sugar phosphate isomerase/epimerase